jgi:molecular chaperone GrpE
MSRKKNKDELKDKDIVNEKQLDETEVESIVSELKPEEDIENKLLELEAGIEDWKDKYLRSMADFDNYRRRSMEEKSDWIKRASEKLALSVCDILDNFDRALLQLNNEQKEDNFIKGIIQIDQQLKSALEKEGVKRIEAMGEEFDPKVHEALAHIPSGYEEGKVAAIIQNGYTMHDKLIRPVRVAVSSGQQVNINNKE